MSGGYCEAGGAINANPEILEPGGTRPEVLWDSRAEAGTGLSGGGSAAGGHAEGRAWNQVSSSCTVGSFSTTHRSHSVHFSPCAPRGGCRRHH